MFQRLHAIILKFKLKNSPKVFFFNLNLRMKAQSRQNAILLYHSSLFLNNLLRILLLVFVYVAVVDIEETQFVGKLGIKFPWEMPVTTSNQAYLYMCIFQAWGLMIVLWPYPYNHFLINRQLFLLQYFEFPKLIWYCFINTVTLSLSLDYNHNMASHLTSITWSSLFHHSV